MFPLHIRSDQSLICVRLFATPCIAARQASLSITNSQSSLRLTSIKSVMPSSHLILCRPLLLLPPDIKYDIFKTHESHVILTFWYCFHDPDGILQSLPKKMTLHFNDLFRVSASYSGMWVSSEFPRHPSPRLTPQQNSLGVVVCTAEFDQIFYTRYTFFLATEDVMRSWKLFRFNLALSSGIDTCFDKSISKKYLD